MSHGSSGRLRILLFLGRLAFVCTVGGIANTILNFVVMYFYVHLFDPQAKFMPGIDGAIHFAFICLIVGAVIGFIVDMLLRLQRR